ncbi:MAG TPA: hypothetical protein VE967_02525, partial [Gemmatimonadaceae bacterium]|nr:hypothetical protein [Gemmatimonadaceae bacterium]
MPPIRRFATPDAALAAIALNDKGADRSWARVRRRDGSVAAGPVLDSNPDQLILGTLSNTGAVRIS